LESYFLSDINMNALNKMTSPPPSPLEGEGWGEGKTNYCLCISNKRFSIGQTIDPVGLLMPLDGGQHNQGDRREHDQSSLRVSTLNPSPPPLSIRGGWVGLNIWLSSAVKVCLPVGREAHATAFQCNVKVYMSNTSRTFRNRLPGE